MTANTKIAWCASTWNPWWGCSRIDVGCSNCYAERLDGRWFEGSHWGISKPRKIFGARHWAEPVHWDQHAAKQGIRRRVFCGSMCDWADEDAPPGALSQLWNLIRSTPNLDWLLLTKRADRISSSLPADWAYGYPNVWLGVTVCTRANISRLEYLRRVPARVHFVSIEPLLENIVLPKDFHDSKHASPIDWLIVGGESGPNARHMKLDWARSLRDQARKAGCAFFMKQLGGYPDKRDEIAAFPADLQIREFPCPTEPVKVIQATMF